MKSDKHTQLKEREEKKQNAKERQSFFPGKVKSVKEYAEYPVRRKHTLNHNPQEC